MTVETDDDEEEAVLDELGGECDTLSRKFYLTTAVPQMKMTTKAKTRKQRVAVYPLTSKVDEILNSPLGIKAIDRTLYEEIRLVSSDISRMMSNMLHQSPI